MGNHISLFYWLSYTTKIKQSTDKSFFSISDEAGNDLTFYDDKKQMLFKAFCKALPKAKVEISL